LRFSPAIAILSLTACGGESERSVGAFTVELTEGGASISVRHPSGLSISTRPNESFAFRTADATIDMEFGAFKFEEIGAGPWITAAAIADLSAGENGGARGVLNDAQGERIADLELDEVQGSLRIRAAAADPSMTRALVRLACDAQTEGGFLGFGAQSHDVDHRGQRVPIWVSEQGIGKTEDDVVPELWPLLGTRHQSYLPVPTMLAPRKTASFGLHATTFRRSIWDLCAKDPNAIEIEVWEGGVEILVSPGPTPLEVIRQQTAHTGRPPLGPDWTFGVWMERVGGEDAVREEARLLRAEHIPASALWSEDWRGGGKEGRSYVLEEDWRLDRALYPRAEDLIAELHRQGLAFMVYFNTFASRSADIFEELRDRKYLVLDRRGDPFLFTGVKFEDTGLADLFRDDARAFVKSELESAVSLGADGWMADYGEWYPGDSRQVAPSGGLDPQEAHHRYPVEWTKLSREVIGDRDVVVFHRSGYTGSQGLAPVIWAGDQRTSFQADDGLPTVIPIMVGLGASGFPIVTHDIGGYISATNPPTTKDLFLRWTALGALGPVMRTHHGRDAEANWRWSSDAETIAIFRRWAELHTRLFPLWKGLAREASESGAPIQRPIAFFDPGDISLHGVKDEYAIGDQLLVAPVVTASTSARMVRFPRGRWFPLEGEGVHEGPLDVEISVPLGSCAVFARAGAIVPMLPEGVESLRPNDAVLDLDEVRFRRVATVWLGANGSTREGEGGRYVLESPSPAVAPLSATTMTVAPNTAVEITDAAGVRHVFRSEGIDPRMEITLEVR
jgi:sulfoquinovosidase